MKEKVEIRVKSFKEDTEDTQDDKHEREITYIKAVYVCRIPLYVLSKSVTVPDSAITKILESDK